MAHMSGLEPETYRLEVGRSILLSYLCAVPVRPTLSALAETLLLP